MGHFCDKENYKVIDLSGPITKHWRYPVEIAYVKSFAKGNCLNIREFNMRTHWYTHIDAPLHYVDGGKSLDDFPLLDMLVGKATVLNINDIGAKEPVTEARLRKAMEGLPMNDMLFIRTDWGRKEDWTTKRFWSEAPYFTKEAAMYVRDLGPRVVGFDFPQDYDIRRASEMREEDVDFTTHEYILKNNILMIEYMNNLWKLPGNVVDIVALPIAIDNADGAQIRVVAIG